MTLRDRYMQPTRSAHDVAAGWLLREEGGRLSPAERVRLERWLEAEPANRRAWDDVRFAMATVADNAGHDDLAAMRTAALAARGERHWRPGLIAATGLVAVALVGLALWTPPRQQEPGATHLAVADASLDLNNAVYRTVVGERAAMTLPDGSIVTLDTDSAVKVAYTGSERGVRLLRGQALFEVAKHKAIPFQVYVGGQRVTAVGTRFDVRLDGDSSDTTVRVALLEGVVRVTNVARKSSRGGPAETVTMAAGELLHASRDGPMRVVVADTTRLASWRSGVLTFDDTPLGEAVTEMNRYASRPIVLADPKLADLRVSGVFKTGDPDHFADTVAEAFPVRVDHGGDGGPILTPEG